MRCLLTAWILGISLSPMVAAATTPGSLDEPVLLQFVRDYANTAGLSDLAHVRPPPGTTEIRIWTGFGVIAPESSIVLTMAPGHSVRGRALYRFRYDENDAESMRALSDGCASDPRRQHDVAICDARLARSTDWAAIWAALEQLGIATLPDESVLPPTRHRVKDGASIVIEIATSEGYRAYAYSNPALRSEPEARAAVDIMRTVNDVFR